MSENRPLVGQHDPSSTPRDGQGKIVQKRTWTAQELSTMSADEYARNMRDPNFLAAVDGAPEDPAQK